MITLIFLCALSEAAENLNYFTIKGGIAQSKNPGGNSGLYAENITYNAGAAIGRQFFDFLSLEIEFMHRGRNILRYSPSPQLTPPVTASWPMQSDAIMFNSNIYFAQSSIKPYLKIGIGISRNKTGIYQVPDNPPRYYNGATVNKFAWQTGVGVSFYVNKNVDAIIEYTLTNHGKIMSDSINRGEDGNMQSEPRSGLLIDNIATIGFKFNF